MNIIAAVDKNWAIGQKNRLLARIPEDMRFFRETTTGKVVVMGRKTLEGFPGGLPLKNRTNIVLTTDKSYQAKGAIVASSLEELYGELKKYPSEDIYVIGGESIYRQLLDDCEVAHITKINHAYEADCWFPNLDELEEWAITAGSQEQTYFGLEYFFYKYEKKSNYSAGIRIYCSDKHHLFCNCTGKTVTNHNERTVNQYGKFYI